LAELRQYVKDALVSEVLLVKAVRGILMRECANLYKSMKIGTLVIFDMLCPNLPGAKDLSGAAILDNSKWLPPEI